MPNPLFENENTWQKTLKGKEEKRKMTSLYWTKIFPYKLNYVAKSNKTIPCSMLLDKYEIVGWRLEERNQASKLSGNEGLKITKSQN